MEGKMNPEEMRLRRERIVRKRTEKRLRKLEGKYERLETKLSSGLTSDMEEALVCKGYAVNLNPMLFRPYALLRYTVNKAVDSYNGDNRGILALILRGIVECGSRYPEYGLTTHKLNAGLKVIVRHITYGPSELDNVYCLDEWSRCLKRYISEPTDSYYEVPADINLLKDNTELNSYFDTIVFGDRTFSYVEENPDAIFNKVFRNLAKCTFDFINSGKAKEPKNLFDLNTVLQGLGCREHVGLSQVLYGELFKFIQSNRFDSFEEFESEGIERFFYEWLAKYDEISAEIIRENDLRRQMRMERQNDSRVSGEFNGEEENNKITQFASPNRETFRTTSLFESSEEESSSSSLSDDDLLTPKDVFLTKEVEDNCLGNTPKRPVRTETFEERSLEKQLKSKLRSAEEINKTIETLQDEIENLQSLLQVKKAALKPLIEQENILWDDIEELQKNLK